MLRRGRYRVVDAVSTTPRPVEGPFVGVEQFELVDTSQLRHNDPDREGTIDTDAAEKPGVYER